MDGSVMEVSKIDKLQIAQRFTNLLWADSPKGWTLGSIYFQETLFVSLLSEQTVNKKIQAIRRSFAIDTIIERHENEDLWGLAADCISEMKNEING